MPLDYDPISTLIWAAGYVLVHGLLHGLVFFPFVFGALWLLKRLAMLIFPAPKSIN
jgi:hypothetical protein